MKELIPSNFKDEILEMFNEGKTSKEISELLNLKQASVTCYLNSKKLYYRPYIGNINYFSEINTNNKAYILGFIAADGALVKTSQGSNSTLTITIHRDDLCVLEFIKKEIGNEHKIQSIRRKSSFDSSKTVDHVRYTITNKQITNDLNKLGINGNKSLTIGNIINNIPKEYRKAFIIGYFDGDGSVSLPKGNTKFNRSKKEYVNYPSYRLNINIRGTKDFLEGIATELELKQYSVKQYDSIPRLVFQHKEAIVKFFKCYEGLEFYLTRKHDKFLERITHPSYKL